MRSAALHPGRDEALPARPDVLVVGGGVVGVTAALACERAGLGSVVLVERDQIGSGATGGAGGLLGVDTLRAAYPDPYVELAQQSVAIWWELQETGRMASASRRMTPSSSDGSTRSSWRTCRRRRPGSYRTRYGRAIANWIVTGKRTPEVAAFAASRFEPP